MCTIMTKRCGSLQRMKRVFERCSTLSCSAFNHHQQQQHVFKRPPNAHCSVDVDVQEPIESYIVASDIASRSLEEAHQHV